MKATLAVAAGVLVAVATACSTQQVQPTSGRPTSTVVPPSSLPAAPSAVPEQLDDGSTMPPPSPPTLAADAVSRAAAAEAATTAMRLFARRDVDAPTWWSDLAPVMSARAAQDYRYVDPGNVPATKVTGRAKVVSQDTPSVARVSVPTNAGVYLLILSRTQEDPQWLVERFTPPETSGD